MTTGDQDVRGRAPAPGAVHPQGDRTGPRGATTDALFYNVMWASVALAFAFSWLIVRLSYPGSNIWCRFLIAAASGFPGAFLYAMLSQIMPRTGGDYVFNSRSLHPSIGFAGNFSYCVWLALIYGLYTTYLATYGFGAFGRMMAGFTGSSRWLIFGNWFSTDYAIFITGTVALLISAACSSVGGLHLFLRLQVVAFALYILGAFLLPVIVGDLPEPGRLHPQLQRLRRQPRHARTPAPRWPRRRPRRASPRRVRHHDHAQSVSVFWYIFGFLYSSNYFAGEIRLRKRTHLLSIPGALLAVVILIALSCSRRSCTSPATTSTGASGFADPVGYGFASRRARLPGDHGRSPRVVGCSAIIIIVGFAVGLLIWLPQTMLLISRSMFAWSFDRIMPGRCRRSTPARTRR